MKPTLFLILALAGCADQSPEGYNGRIPVARVVNVNVQARVVTVDVVALAPESGCWTYDHFDRAWKDYDYYITLVGRRNTLEARPFVPESLAARVSVSVPSPGTYTFHFATSDSTYMPQTILVP